MKGFATISTLPIARLPLATALLMILGSCSTTQTMRGQPKDSFVPPPVVKAAAKTETGRFVPCKDIAIVIFHAQNPDDPTSVETAANIFDTPETISVSRKNNASIREACEK